MIIIDKYLPPLATSRHVAAFLEVRLTTGDERFLLSYTDKRCKDLNATELKEFITKWDNHCNRLFGSTSFCYIAEPVRKLRKKYEELN